MTDCSIISSLETEDSEKRVIGAVILFLWNEGCIAGATPAASLFYIYSSSSLLILFKVILERLS
jgi:hypothetical protein